MREKKNEGERKKETKNEFATSNKRRKQDASRFCTDPIVSTDTVCSLQFQYIIIHTPSTKLS